MAASPPFTAQPSLGRGDWKRLSRLLAQALAVDADSRAGWITSLPESDLDLLPVLKQLLAKSGVPRAVETAESMPRLRLDGLPHRAQPGDSERDERPGVQVGPNRLLRELGVGGIGSVWLAERTDGSYQRQDALKLPCAEWTDRGLSERMARERAVLASLNQPNIAQMYEAGWAADGRPNLALEYVDGAPIDAWCKRHALALAARVKPFIDVAWAMASASLLMLAWVVVPTADAQQAQTLDRVTITGSNIQRADQETVAPVEIITREQIERTGRPTIADVLRTIPANLGGSYSESFTNSFAPGAAGISLRGLGQKTTLVLLNGRRVAGYGFAQNLQDTFVDLNAIPTSAIDRVEILKDGASAIYGSDAIAGVINIILRRDYKGIEAGGSVGFFEGANDYRANLVAGFGDFGSDKFNVFGVFDYYKRDKLLYSDTKHGETLDFRGEDGGRNFESLSAGGTWLSGNNRRAMSECTQYGGFVIDYAGAVERGLIAPGTSTALNLPGNTWCGYDFANERTALPATERYGLLGRGTYDFSATTQAFAEFGWSRVQNYQSVPSPFFTGVTALTQTAVGLRPFTYNVTFGPGVAGNPFDSNSTFFGVVHGLGTTSQETKSDSYRLLGGLRYSSWGWDFESAIGWSKNEVAQADFHRLSKTATSAAFGVPSDPTAGPPPAFPPNPVSTSSTVNLDQPSTTLAAAQAMLITVNRTAESELRFIDTKATTAIGKLPGGPVGLAVGAEFRTEHLRDNFDPRAAQGDVLGSGIAATDGGRDSFAMYAELALPLTQQLEGQLALRHDGYSDFGSALTPKIGAKFKATPELLFRANWGRGFRAPTLPEISPSTAIFFTAVIDPLTSQLTQVSGVFAGNPQLNPEKSRNTTVGIVWEPNTSFTLALDWYQIAWSNIVASPSFQAIVNSGDPNRVFRDPVTGRIVSVYSGYENLLRTETSGVDVDARWIARTASGRFTTRLNATYVDSFEEEGVECAGTNGCTNTYPRWKGYLSLDWDRGPWTATARVNYIHSYYQMMLPRSFFVPQDPRFQTGTYPERVPSYTTLDLFARHDVSPMLRVFASIINVTDETPPYVGTFGYDFTQYDIRGRQYRIGFNYKFR